MQTEIDKLTDEFNKINQNLYNYKVENESLLTSAQYHK